MEFTYQPVWKKITPELTQEMIAFWTAENALPKQELPEARAQQAVIVMRDSDGKMAAVCTATVRIIPRLRQPLYYYRTYCAKAFRGQHTVQAMAQEAKKTLLAYNQNLQPPEAIGIMVELENSQLVSQYVQAHHAATDFSFVGYSQREFPIFVHYFAGFNLLPPAALPQRPTANATGEHVRRSGGRARNKPAN